MLNLNGFANSDLNTSGITLLVRSCPIIPPTPDLSHKLEDSIVVCRSLSLILKFLRTVLDCVMIPFNVISNIMCWISI